MKILTRQLGELEFDETFIITFPEGLIGFEQHQRFIIVNDEDSEPFRWLISIDDSDIGFPLIEPALVYSDYQPNLSFSSEEASLFSIVTLNPHLEKVTLNLKGPIIIHNNSRIGKQVVLPSDKYTTAHPMF
jgi:flagellar assembly factor FliW